MLVQEEWRLNPWKEMRDEKEKMVWLSLGLIKEHDMRSYGGVAV
jgi:hypothetical protein